MSTCPQCRRNVAMVHGRSRPPQGDDIVVCSACGAICFFTTALDLRLLTPKDQRRFPVRLLLEAIRLSDSIITAPSSRLH